MDINICEKKTKELISQYIPRWEFGYDRARRRFGCTHYADKKITLSRVLCEMNEWEQIKPVVIHEIAHAIAGQRHGHDSTWKKVCIELGGDGRRLYNSDNINTPGYNYIAKCPVCGEVYTRLRKPKGRSSCSVCCKTFSKDRVLVFEKVASPAASL